MCAPIIMAPIIMVPILVFKVLRDESGALLKTIEGCREWGYMYFRGPLGRGEGGDGDILPLGISFLIFK